MKKRQLSPFDITVLWVLLTPVLLGAQTTTSVLSEGQFFKVAVSTPGVYKLDATFLSSTAGINLAQTPASHITLWTNGGGLLPRLANAPRIDDLREVAMLGVGTDDGKVDGGDYFLFYAEGPDSWQFDKSSGKFHKTKNIYDSRNYYFICVSDRTATVIPERSSLAQGDIKLNTFDDYASIEEDKVNLLGKFRPPGSGQRWFGDEFSVVRQRDYGLEFPNIVPGSQVQWTMDFAGRSDVTNSVSAEFNGNKVTKVISGVITGDGEAAFALIAHVTGSYTATQDIQNIHVSYPQVSATSSGWLDYIEAQAQRQLTYDGTPMVFRAIASLDAASVEYHLAGLTDKDVIWDITDPQRPVSQEYVYDASDGTDKYAINGDSVLREFLVFTPGTAFATPQPVGSVANQNIHGIERADLVILYHPDFADAAMRLASHRLVQNGYVVEAIPIDALMNEFAGGGQDPTAIRDFARMLKSRDSDFRFLLLFGDGSYDLRHLNTDQADENFIPVFETTESMYPIKSFPSDDYFALLSDDEGADLKGAIDIAVGRLPIRTADEADLVVDKLISYDSDAETFGDWRLGITYVADDEDSNQHLLQTEDVANTQNSDYPVYNDRKIYLDAFQQVTTPGGQRYPDVNEAINNAVDKGTLILNYFGHGGPAGWAQERVLGVSDIQSWTNYHKLAVFVTATCSFTPYDEPSLRSAGELVLMNPSGGAVALLTTVRAVYSSSNKRLTSEVFARILQDQSNGPIPIGEVMMLAKNSNHQDTVDVNARKFALIGDPSMQIALPKNAIAVTTVNGHDVMAGIQDTVGALELVTIEGEVRDQMGQKLSLFNGILTATVFDKPATATTLANDPKSYEKTFQTQTKVLFKGTVTVTDGTFSLTFVVPQDINFVYGSAKVSLYATDGMTDAAGYYRDLVIGGGTVTSIDQEGPDIQMYIDNMNFKSGDETGPNPFIIINLEDESGINITGNSIGHDLEGVLDGDLLKKYILNDLYVATIDDHTSGAVRLPLTGLSDGLHTFKVTAWDIANNFSEASIDFRVVSDPDLMVRNVRNGPNPFSSETAFAFEHELGEVPIDVEIDIFSATGSLVQQLVWDNVVSQGNSVDGLQWDGSAKDGGTVLPGVYFYRILLTGRPGTNQETRFESKYGKLIVVN